MDERDMLPHSLCYVVKNDWIDVFEAAPLLGLDVDALVNARWWARMRKDYHLADKIRAQLLDMNVIVEDSRDGPRWRVKR